MNKITGNQMIEKGDSVEESVEKYPVGVEKYD